MTKRSRPSTSTTGSRESLRAREVGGAGGGVRDRQPGGSSSSPARVGAPAPVVERLHPGEADRDVGLPVAPGAAERVGDQHRRRGLARAAGELAQARADRARGGVGVAREQHDACSGAGALEASTPALAHTKPWRVRQISTPRAARRSSCGLVEHDLDERAGPCPARPASASARAAGWTCRERHDRALGLGDDLVGDRRSAARRSGARRPSAASTSAAMSSPARTSGSAVEAARAEACSRGRSLRRGVVSIAAPRSLSPSTARVRGRARAAARQALAQRLRGPRRCRCRAAATAAARSASRAGVAREREVALAAAGPEARGRSRRAGSAAGRWCRCRGGRARSRPRPAVAMPAARREQRLSSAGSSAGQSPGTHSARSNPSAQRARDAERRRRRSGPPRAESRHHDAPRGRSPRPPTRSSLLTTIVSSIASRRAERCSTSRHHRRGELHAQRSATLSPSRCLARVKRFTGRIAAVRIVRPEPTAASRRARAWVTRSCASLIGRSESANASVCSATRARAASSSMRVSMRSAGQAARPASSATIPSSSSP